MFLKMHKRLFGVEAKKVGGDAGYAGKDNRDYCKVNGLLNRKHAHRNVLSRGNYASVIENG